MSYCQGTVPTSGYISAAPLDIEFLACNVPPRSRSWL